VAERTARDLGVEADEPLLERRMERRQDCRHALLGAPADAALRGRERLEERRVRLLEWLRHHGDGAHDPIDDPGAVTPRRLEVPRGRARRDAPVAPVVGEELLGPRLLDDPEALLEG